MAEPITIPFGDLAPDLGMVSGFEGDSHLLIAANVLPLGRQGYAPAGDVVDAGFGQTPASKPTGSALFNQQYLYFGTTDGDLYEADYSGLTITSRHTPVSSGVNWSLTRFGDSMIATNFEDPVQVQTARAGTFANLITKGAGAPVDAQTEADYATFAGGLSHAAPDTITLSDGSTVASLTVDGSGTVTAFTIDSSTSTGNVSVGDELTQSSTTGSGTGFSVTVAAANFNPRLQAKYVSTFGSRIVLANLKTTGATLFNATAGDYPYSIYWSGIQAANSFDPLDLGLNGRSGYQTFPTKYGVITGVEEVGELLYVFFERGIRAMKVGGGVLPNQFDSYWMVEGSSTIHPRSIFAHGNTALFWGPAGPAVASPSGYAELGGDKIASTLSSGRWPLEIAMRLDRSLDEPNIIGCLSPSMNSYIWSYPPTDSAYSVVLLIYNYRVGRFGTILFRKNAADPVIDNSITLLEDRTDVYSEDWELGTTLAIGSWDGSNVTIRKFSDSVQGGENGTSAQVGPMRFIMAFRQLLESLTSQPQHVQAIVSPAAGSSGLPTMSVTVRSKRAPMIAHSDEGLVETTISTTDSPFEDPATGGGEVDGWMSLLADVSSASKSPEKTRYHQFDITITPTGTWHCVEAQGIEVKVEPGGSW